MKRLLVALWFVCNAACPAPLALPAPPDAGLEQHIGARIPLDTIVADETGRGRRLSDLVDGTRPVLLVPGYYRCAQLCGLVMRGLLDSLQASGVGRTHWRIVGVGIDPRETPADARQRSELDIAYANSLSHPEAGPLDLHLLTLAAPQLQRVANTIGIRFDRLPATSTAPATIAHPATVVLLTPRGDIARYFNGLGIAPGELRVAIADAAGDRLGSVSGRLALLCAHFDPRVGKLDAPVLNAVRAVSLLLVAGLAGWCWRWRGTRAGDKR